MGIRTMKKDLFTIKALESKGFDLEKLLSLTDAEVEALPISTKLIDGIKEIRARGGKTAEVIAEEIADLMMREESEAGSEQIAAYKETSVVGEEAKSSTPTQVSDDLWSVESASADSEVDVHEEEPDEADIMEEPDVEAEVEIVRVASSEEDVKIIKEALQTKDAKSFQPFIKHLKAEVPAAILDAVDSTLVSKLIEDRIAEVKAATEKTK